MADQKNKMMDLETERNLNAECLAVEISGQTWHVPFDTLHGIPRVGETIRFAGGSSGKVALISLTHLGSSTSGSRSGSGK